MTWSLSSAVSGGLNGVDLAVPVVEPQRDSRGLSWQLALVVFLVGLLLRLLYLVETREVPTLQHLVGDAAGYRAWAHAIANEDWLGREPFYQAPLYPYMLACVQNLFGADIWIIRLVQSILGAASGVMLAIAGALHFGRRVGLLAGLLFATYPPALFFDGIIQKASLAGLLCSLAVVLIAWILQRAGAGKCLLLGFAIGLLSITRENAFVWLVLLGFWLGWRLRSRRGVMIRCMLLYAVGFGLVLGAVGYRNYHVAGEWSLSTFQAGPNFYIGNGSAADGRYRPLVAGQETPDFERSDAVGLAEQAVGRGLSAREVSHFWMARAWREIDAGRIRWLRLMAYKMALVCNRYEIGDAESQYIYARESRLLSGLQRVWHFGILLPLAVVGVLASRRQLGDVWVYTAMIASMGFAVGLFFVLARYRFPLVPLLVPFAAVGLLAILRSIRERSLVGVARHLLPALVVGVLVNVPIQDERRLDGLATMNVGVALAQAGELDESLPFFRRAVEVHPRSAEARYNLAQALSLMGMFGESIEHYRAVLAAKPVLRGVHFNLGVALERVGRREEAVAAYALAFESDPGDEEAARALQRLR